MQMRRFATEPTLSWKEFGCELGLFFFFPGTGSHSVARIDMELNYIAKVGFKVAVILLPQLLGARI